MCLCVWGAFLTSLTPMNEMIPVDLPGGGLGTQDIMFKFKGKCSRQKKVTTCPTYFSSVRFPSSPRPLTILLGLGLGVGFGLGATTGHSVAGAMADFSGFFLLSTSKDSVGGAEINALI